MEHFSVSCNKDIINYSLKDGKLERVLHNLTDTP